MQEKNFKKGLQEIIEFLVAGQKHGEKVPFPVPLHEGHHLGLLLDGLDGLEIDFPGLETDDLHYGVHVRWTHVKDSAIGARCDFLAQVVPLNNTIK